MKVNVKMAAPEAVPAPEAAPENQEIIHRKQITTLLNSGKIQELQVTETAADDKTPAKSEVHMVVIKGQPVPGVLRPPAQQAAQAAQAAAPAPATAPAPVPEAEPAPEPQAAAAKVMTRMTREAARKLAGYPDGFLKAMGLI